jgi:hypothetical protein
MECSLPSFFSSSSEYTPPKAERRQASRATMAPSQAPAVENIETSSPSSLQTLGQMGNCETAAPHASSRIAVACTSESTRLSTTRKRMPVKTVLREERIW